MKNSTSIKIETLVASEMQQAGRIVTVTITDMSNENIERIMKETGADVLEF